MAAIFGGAGLKTIEYMLGKGDRRDNVQLQFREELRMEIAALRSELKLVDDNLKIWREKYYEVFSYLSLARHHLIQAGLHEEAESIPIRVNGHASKDDKE